MPVLKKLIEQRGIFTDTVKKAWQEAFGGPTATGINVTHNSAMACTAWYAGVRIYAETMGFTPLIEYRRLEPRGKRPATDRKLYQLLHDEPNPEMNPGSFKECLQGQAVNWGNAFAEIEWDVETGMPLALWPLLSSNMQVGRDPKTRELIYVYTLPDGGHKIFPSWRIWHLPGFGYDGVIGYDAIYQAREAIGMTQAMEKYGGKFFGNGLSPSGVLEHPNKLTKEAHERLKDSKEALYGGLDNAHRLVVLEEGMKYHQISIPPDNAQFLESRKFQLEEICRWLHIPPHMLADLDRATFSNIEHLFIEFVQMSMMPWYTRWEETCTRKLLLKSEKPYFFCECLVDVLLRGDSAARAAFYKELFYLGSLSPNDIREKENLNPITDPGGDKYYIQQNMVPMDMAGSKTAAQTFYLQNSLFQETVKKIAERERQSILRAARKYNTDDLRKWLADYYRDIPEYIERQMEPFQIDTKEFITRYIGASMKRLADITPDKAEEMLAGWAEKRMEETDMI